MKNTRYVIIDKKTGSAYMGYDTIQECIDRMTDYEKQEVYDTIKEDIVDILMYLFGFEDYR